MRGMLLAATQPNDVIKDLQEKVISLQDHEISFLNDTISNIWAAVGVSAAVVSLIFTGAFAYVAYLNRQAQMKVEEATANMKAAEDKMSAAEQRILDADAALERANLVMSAARDVAHTAQEKVTNLEQEQSVLRNLSSRVELSQRLDMTFTLVKLQLDLVYVELEDLKNDVIFGKRYSEDLLKWAHGYFDLTGEYKRLLLSVSTAIVNKESMSEEQEQKTKELGGKCTKFLMDFYDFVDKIKGNTSQ